MSSVNQPSSLKLQSARIDQTWISSGEQRLATSLDLPEAGPPWPVVMLVHGLGGNRIGRSYMYVELGQRLARQGIACVRFDQSGCGESSGDQLQYGLSTVQRDCAAVREWLHRDARFSDNDLAIVGSSQGALGAMSCDAEFGSRGVVLWAPVFDLPTLVRSSSEGMERNIPDSLRNFGFAAYRGLRLGATYFNELDLLDPTDLLQRSSSPMLLAHSYNDELVPISHSRQILGTCRSFERRCRLMKFDQTTHEFFEEPARSRVLSLSTRWIGRALRV